MKLDPAHFWTVSQMLIDGSLQQPLCSGVKDSNQKLNSANVCVNAQGDVGYSVLGVVTEKGNDLILPPG